MQNLQPHQAGMMIKKDNNEEQTDFLPLTEVNVEAEIIETIAHIKMTQEYENPSRDEPQDASDEPKGKPINLAFKFPKEKDTLISKMMITIGEKTIEAKIMENEKAEQVFDDAMASGNTAAMVSDAR